MLSPADYDDYRNKQRSDDAARSKLLIDAGGGEPAETPENIQLASTVAAIAGKNPAPPEVVADNRKLFDEVVDNAKLDEIRTSAPKLAEWLSQKQNYALAKGDLDNLVPIAQTLARVGQAPKVPPPWEVWPTDNLIFPAASSVMSLGNPGVVDQLRSADNGLSGAGKSPENLVQAAVPAMPLRDLQSGGADVAAPSGASRPDGPSSGRFPADLGLGGNPNLPTSTDSLITFRPPDLGKLGGQVLEAPKPTVDLNTISDDSDASRAAPRQGTWIGGWVSEGADLPPAPDLSDRSEHIDRIANAANATDEEVADLRQWIRQQRYFDADSLDDLLSRTYAGKTPANEARAEMEPLFAPITNAIARGLWRVAVGYQQYAAEHYRQLAMDQQRSFGAILDDENSLKGSFPGADDLIGAGIRWLQAKSSFSTSDHNMSIAADYERRAGDTFNRVNEIPHSVAATRYLNLSGNPAQDQSFLGRFSKEPLGYGALALESMLEGTTADAVAASAGALTRSPAVAAAVAVGTSYSLERYASPVEYLMAKQIDVSTPDGALRVMADQKLFDEAKNYGDMRALIIALLDGVSGHIAGKELVKNPIGNILAQTSSSAGLAMAGETAAQIASGQKLDMDAIVLTGLGAAIKSAGQQAGEAGLKAIGKDLTDAQLSVEHHEIVRQLSEQVKASDIRERDPKALESLVKDMTKGTAAEFFYISGDSFAKYFKSIDSDPKGALSRLGIPPSKLDVALQADGDLRLPAAGFLTTFAGTKSGDALLPQVRFDPGLPTMDEALKLNREGWGKIWEISKELSRRNQPLGGHPVAATVPPPVGAAASAVGPSQN